MRGSCAAQAWEGRPLLRAPPPPRHPSPLHAQAIVNAENSSAVHIIVGSADVYDPLYHASLDVKSGNLADLGVQIGRLLAMLRASSCATAACDVLEGLLHPSTRREVLLNVPERLMGKRTGTLTLRSVPSSDKDQDGSILDAAMQLQCKEFIKVPVPSRVM